MPSSGKEFNPDETWIRPNPDSITYETGLKVMNSLTRRMDPFITMDGSRSLYWYMCGPTVYAPSHLGHARTYLAFDIVRRILTKYLNYDVTLVMNITDIDDKIIARSWEQGIPCKELSSKFEAEFFEDLAALGVAPPDVLTRVTEFVPEVVEYIERIIENGKAYESNGSVYFDVGAFSCEAGRHYCKLNPENQNNSDLLAEGEGKLTQDFISDKKSPRDFALWKKSKPNEPAWDSPWGPGRPGWHIECSAMATHVFAATTAFNGQMDIHSGGQDLKFPHHDNEMAQSEAYSCMPQWVNYFVHSGHLHIDGFKMSKSLKNFITIREALKMHTSRQIRLCFLLHKYNANMDYGDNTMQHAIITEKFFSEFFHNVKACLRQFTIASPQSLDSKAFELQKTLSTCKSNVDNALLQDFDTPVAIQALTDLAKAVNLYIRPDNTAVVSLIVSNCALYITSIFKMLGLIPDNHDAVGFPSSSSMQNGGTINDQSKEQLLTPILDMLMDFRSKVREHARSNAKDTSAKLILDECDNFRDNELPLLGIRLEDKPAGSLWKLDDPEVLKKERELKLAELKRKEEEKIQKQREQEKKDALNRLPPVEFMKQLTLEDNSTLKYSKFDESSGLPTYFHNGEPLNKNQEKKAKKEWSAQQKKYEKAVKSM